ncbi:28S ribosomal protein S23, mitochondrial-like [Dendronephthya gigantea]|uniref:28S ribosomal protein S23, mitochondrial-like n=1 Tax=Dendronephthya gigantea TaxID=151771 RepID=UPI00106CA4A6|nr:28S ribosomal protein S23, mitochondrial-like [Dendronephthya gigantea]
MASSRHLKGTLLSRVKDLLKSGVLKDKPVWYDVVVAFPPIVEADLLEEPGLENVGRIAHSEDSLRRDGPSLQHAVEDKSWTHYDFLNSRNSETNIKEDLK